MSEYADSFRSLWGRWLDIDLLLPLLHCGFRQRERLASYGEGTGFTIKSNLCLGVGVARIFKMI